MKPKWKTSMLFRCGDLQPPTKIVGKVENERLDFNNI